MRLPWSRRSRGSTVAGLLTDSRARKSLGRVVGHLLTHPRLLASVMVLGSRLARGSSSRGKKTRRLAGKLLPRGAFSKTRRALSRVLR